MNRKYYLIFAALAVVLAGVCGFLYITSGETNYRTVEIAKESPKPGSSSTKKSKDNSTTAKTDDTSNQSEDNAQETIKQTVSGSSSQTRVAPIQESNIKTTLRLDTGNGSFSYRVTIPAGSTAYTQLANAAKENGFALKVKNYSYGVFVEQIRNVINNPSNATFWMFYVNSRLSNKGCSSYILRKGDTVLWKYEKEN